MDQIVWILWLTLGIGLMIAEIFTFSFFLFWFGLGAVAAAAVAFLGFGFVWQFAAFAIVSVLFTLMSRTIFTKYLHSSDEMAMKMGIDALPGQVGTVTHGSAGPLNKGAVKVFGSTWTAYPVDGSTELVEGEKVEVVSVKGASIYVRLVRDELPGWRSD